MRLSGSCSSPSHLPPSISSPNSPLASKRMPVTSHSAASCPKQPPKATYTRSATIPANSLPRSWITLSTIKSYLQWWRASSTRECMWREPNNQCTVVTQLIPHLADVLQLFYKASPYPHNSRHFSMYIGFTSFSTINLLILLIATIHYILGNIHKVKNINKSFIPTIS